MRRSAEVHGLLRHAGRLAARARAPALVGVLDDGDYDRFLREAPEVLDHFTALHRRPTGRRPVRSTQRLGPPRNPGQRTG